MPAGRVAKELISVLGTVAAVSTGAYLVTRPRPPTAPDPGARRIRELERRLAALECSGAAIAPAPAPPVAIVPVPLVAPATPAAAVPEPGHVPVGPMHKPYTVTHYENLASQVAHERQIAELERRLAAIEALRGGGMSLHNGVPGATGAPKYNGMTTRRDRRHG